MVVVIRRPRVLRWCSRSAALRPRFDFHMGMAWTVGFCVDTLAESWSKGQLLNEGPCTIFEIAEA